MMTENKTREQAPEQFRGCAKPCWLNEEHTYAHGSCAQAANPPVPDPVFSHLGPPQVINGRKQVEIYEIPALAVLPWLRFLPYSERLECLDDVAKSDRPAHTLLEWRETARVWADPQLLETLAGPFDSDGYAEVEQPEPLHTTDGRKVYGQITVPDFPEHTVTVIENPEGGIRIVGRLTDTAGREHNTDPCVDAATAHMLIAALKEFIGEDDDRHDVQEAAAVTLLIPKKEETPDAASPTVPTNQ